MKIKTSLIMIVLCSLTTLSVGQHEHNQEHSGNMHKLTIVMAHSHIPTALDDNKNVIVPSWGFNYDYLFHHKWGIGLHSELILQQFKVEREHSSKELTRENPISVCGVITFKPHHKWTILGGGGVELEAKENIAVAKLGVEYGIELIKDWELGLSLEYDHKIDAYGSWLFGVGFSKLLYNRKE